MPVGKNGNEAKEHESYGEMTHTHSKALVITVSFHFLVVTKYLDLYFDLEPLVMMQRQRYYGIAGRRHSMS